MLVFNCDGEFDFKSVGRIFIGLVKCGAWGCFDEFNRLEENVLSAVSQQIQLIQVCGKRHLHCSSLFLRATSAAVVMHLTTKKFLFGLLLSVHAVYPFCCSYHAHSMKMIAVYVLGDAAKHCSRICWLQSVHAYGMLEGLQH